MTTLQKPLKRATNAQYRGRQITVELHPNYIATRESRGREAFSCSYGDLHEILMMRRAKANAGDQTGLQPRKVKR